MTSVMYKPVVKLKEQDTCSALSEYDITNVGKGGDDN